MSDRKKIILAVMGALLLEAAIILVSERATVLWPSYAPAPAAEEQKLPELTMVDPPPPATSEDRKYSRTNDDQKSDTPPKDPAFESDKDTAAASEKEGKENAPLPTQDGKDIPDQAFKNEDYSLDTKGQNFTRNSGPQATQAQEAQKQEQQTAAATPTPTPTPQPQPTAQDYAMLRPVPTPQPQMPMQGNINNRGRSSVAALGTPSGRFNKAVSDAIGSRWYRYVSEHSDLINIGTVVIRFNVLPDGRVKGATVMRNTSSESLASFSLQAVMDAQIPPMPEEMISAVPESGLQLDFTFSFN
jgi:outer membrane biosynthesis protein TonB